MLKVVTLHTAIHTRFIGLGGKWEAECRDCGKAIVTHESWDDELGDVVVGVWKHTALNRRGRAVGVAECPGREG